MVETLFLSELEVDRKLTDNYLDRMLGGSDGPAGPVQEAMRYAVLGSGQRLRPLLALRTARILGCECAGTLRAAAAVELLHCASLIADDLPCMDDSPMRRGRPSTHVAFGEPLALLASYSLIALAARSLMQGALSNEELRAMLHFQNRLLGTLDCGSLIAGQAMDLQLTGEARHRQLAHISELKTVPLFQLAMHAGALFAPDSRELEQPLDLVGREIGLLYQLVDDYLDGDDRDARALDRQLAAARGQVKVLGSRAHLLEDMLEFLYAKAF